MEATESAPEAVVGGAPLVFPEDDLDPGTLYENWAQMKEDREHTLESSAEALRDLNDLLAKCETQYDKAEKQLDEARRSVSPTSPSTGFEAVAMQNCYDYFTCVSRGLDKIGRGLNDDQKNILNAKGYASLADVCRRGDPTLICIADCALKGDRSNVAYCSPNPGLVPCKEDDSGR